jgi:polar amino acid transport system substrate-binding protein
MNNKYRILIFGMAIILAACVGKKPETINTYSDLKGKVIGMVSSGATSESLFALISKYGIGADPKEVVLYNSGSDLIAAILAGKVDGAPGSSFATDYLVKRNANLRAVEVKTKVENGIIMVLRGDEQPLKEDINGAIKTLRENGTLKTLADEWITNLPVNSEPSQKEMFRAEGARTVYVGVTGNYAPLDYMGADGKPAGYNIAMLNELGKLLKVNFETVSLEAQARFTALRSKKIDIVFCQVYSSQVATLFNKPGSQLIMTEPYYTDPGLVFLVRK